MARLTSAANEGRPADVHAMLASASMDITFRTMFGKEPYDPPEIQRLEDDMREDTEWAEQAAVLLSPGEVIPWPRFIPDRNTKRAKTRKKARSRILRDLFDIVRSRPSFAQRENACIADFMLKQQQGISKQAVETSCSDMLLVTNPATRSIMQWWLLILANRPDVQAAIREELDQPTASSKLRTTPAELPYTANCYHECLRYRTPAPLGVPHPAPGRQAPPRWSGFTPPRWYSFAPPLTPQPLSSAQPSQLPRGISHPVDGIETITRKLSNSVSDIVAGP